MSHAERKEFMKRVQEYLQSARLTDEAFADLTLLYASLNDQSLSGVSFERLRKYEEVGKGWAEINVMVGQSQEVQS